MGEKGKEKSCRCCLEQIQDRAKKCKHCGAYQAISRAALPVVGGVAGILSFVMAAAPVVIYTWASWLGEPKLHGELAVWTEKALWLTVENNGWEEDTPRELLLLFNG